VFIIESLNPRPVPLAKLGTFCSGDAYLVLHVRWRARSWIRPKYA